MAIFYSEKDRTLTLHTDRTTYQMQVGPYGHLLHLYYGRRTEGCLDYLLTYRDRGFSGNPAEAGGDRTYSLDALPQEYPVQGNGDYRSVLFSVRDQHGTFGADLRYREHRIRPGKYALDGLPSVYSESDADDAETLEVVLESTHLPLTVTLLYGILPHLDIITRSAVIRNTGDEDFTLEKAGTANLDFLSGDFEMTVFAGRHAYERIPHRFPVGPGSHRIGSRRGTSSHQYNPMILLSDPDTTEDSGRCWSMQFVYSGGFFAGAERDSYGQTRMQMGLAGEKFSYPLRSGTSFTAPEVILSYSDEGFSRLSHNLHACLRTHVVRGKYRDAARPVLINSWEACYFDFNGETILRMAENAKELGVEMIVMDDGWFGERSDDLRALGDWTPNEAKLGCTLSELSEKIHAMGLSFGIWMEPEMISEDSDLFRAHPDWALRIPGKLPIRSRDQLVLDLSRPEIVDALFHQITAVFDSCRIDYLKWDINRSIADVYSAETEPGRVLHDYMLGLYDLLERLVCRYPDLLLESCSGGGGRFDAGMLYYSPQIWCSDNTDPIDRLRIQYGTSFGYPASAAGAHVSVSPNEQTGRRTPLRTRAAVAMAGTFGYELDPAKLTPEERDEIRQQILAFKQDEALIRTGRYYRLSDPDRAPYTAWAFVSEDRREALLTAVFSEIHGNIEASYLVPCGLAPNAFYRCRETGRTYPSDALLELGLPLPFPSGEYESVTYHLERVTDAD